MRAQTRRSFVHDFARDRADPGLFAGGARPFGTENVALGVRPDGTKDVLGLWIEQSEGAKFWLRVMNELKSRGVEDVLIARSRRSFRRPRCRPASSI